MEQRWPEVKTLGGAASDLLWAKTNPIHPAALGPEDVDAARPNAGTALARQSLGQDFGGTAAATGFQGAGSKRACAPGRARAVVNTASLDRISKATKRFVGNQPVILIWDRCARRIAAAK